MPTHTTTRRITTNLKTKNYKNCQKIKLWKSNNQGFKEEIFIQMDRRGKDDMLCCGEVVAGGSGKVAVAATWGMGSPTLTCGR